MLVLKTEVENMILSGELGKCELELARWKGQWFSPQTDLRLSLCFNMIRIVLAQIWLSPFTLFI